MSKTKHTMKVETKLDLSNSGIKEIVNENLSLLINNVLLSSNVNVRTNPEDLEVEAFVPKASQPSASADPVSKETNLPMKDHNLLVSSIKTSKLEMVEHIEELVRNAFELGLSHNAK